MAFITKQSVAFNILNNIQEDSTADYIEKSKPAMVGEIREWKGGKFRKTVNGWEPVKEGSENNEKKEDVDLEKPTSHSESDNIKVGSVELTHTSNLISLFKELKKEPEKYKEAIKTLEDVGSEWDKVNRITLASKIISAQKKEDGNIVDNVNNGEVINSLFKEWNSIKTSEQHKEWSKKVANTKFGTYKDKTILNVMGDFNPKFPNEIIKKDFINEVQEAYKNSGESKEKEEENPSLIIGDLNYNHNYMIVREGGTIGENKNEYLPQFKGIVYKTSDDQDNLKQLAIRNNKALTPGEKSYYKIKYSVKPITDSIRKYILKEVSKK